MPQTGTPYCSTTDTYSCPPMKTCLIKFDSGKVYCECSPIPDGGVVDGRIQACGPTALNEDDEPTACGGFCPPGESCALKNKLCICEPVGGGGGTDGSGGSEDAGAGDGEIDMSVTLPGPVEMR